MLAAALLAAGEASVVATAGYSLDESLAVFVRLTARTSLAWFLLAFLARPLVALSPAPLTKWLLAHRRGLGLAMAVSHGAHLAGIVALAARRGDALWASLASTTIIGGSLGFVILAAMAATSTDDAQRRLGRSRWRALHLGGMWSLWIIFTSTYAPQAGRGAAMPAVFTALLIVAASTRPLALLRQRSRRLAR